MNMTPPQQAAIASKGDTLVMAGAGTGKTRTLVQRCLDRLLNAEPPLHLDQMLLVTFTEAAAAEIRQRIRNALEDLLDTDADPDRVQAHLAALDTAPIGTLHSFCLKLVRQHFHELAIDPQVAVLAEEQSALIKQEVLDTLFEAHYDSEEADSERFRRFLGDYARGWEDQLKTLLLGLHAFTQTRPDPAGWYRQQQAALASSEPESWRSLLREAVEAWRQSWLPVWESESAENPWRDRMVSALREPGAMDDAANSRGDREEVTGAPSGGPVSSCPRLRGWYVRLAELMGRIEEIDQDRPSGSVKNFREPLKDFYKEKDFLATFLPGPDDNEPVAEDWGWVREHLQTLIDLAVEFGDAYAADKRERGVMDFNDLEQFALRLLWDPEKRLPTELARDWRRQLELVFVDEYQDINEAQDTLIRALSREGPASNRFLVGDVKQSIYRFRQAEPRIFQDYADRWDGGAAGRTIFLSDNFRSREGLLAFINPLFASLMRRSVGGVAYDEDAALRFGDREGRAALVWSEGQKPAVEIHLQVKEKPDVEDEPASSHVTSAEREARLVACRLRALKEAGHPVWDADLKATRPVAWRDMVVLLRAPGSRVEAFAKEFATAGVPLQARRTGFFDSIEVRDLIHLLELLDNPLQDTPTVAVLRSPLAGFTLDELARIRLGRRVGPFWKALTSWHRSYDAGQAREPKAEEDDAATGEAEERPRLERTPDNDRLFEKASLFLERYHRWRQQGRYLSLTQRLELVLQETAYRDWLLTQPRGEQRQANVARLLTLAKEFDEMQAQGLHRFLRMLEAQKNAAGDREPAQVDAGDAVRLMSIHQSKGLEFPIVVAADLGHRFNLGEGRAGMVLDEVLGICPVVRWPETGQHYSSLPLWMARKRQRAEALGEELRILYVVLTRAQDRLILTGTASEKDLEETWPDQASPAMSDRQRLKATSPLSWIGPWLCSQVPDWRARDSGDSETWSWQLHRDTLEPPEVVPEPPTSPVPDQADVEALCARLVWEYPQAEATHAVAKSSVSVLRRQWTEEDDESKPASFAVTGRFQSHRAKEGGLSAADIGTAHHRFLQWVDVAGAGGDLAPEVARLTEAGRLTGEEADVLNLEHLSRFWQSEVGQAIREHSGRVKREWPFTCRLASEDLLGLEPDDKSPVPAGDFVVIQGVADLVVLFEDDVWLLDFKTDHVAETALEEKVRHYRPQLKLYGLALAKILGRPVTKSWLHFLALGRTVEV